MKREYVISFRLNKQEYDKLAEQAKKYNTKINKLARLKTTNKEKVLCNSILLNNFLQLTGQTKRLGNNINQICRYINYYKRIDKVAAEELIKQQEQLQDLIKQLQKTIKELKRC